jgi:hypothetical protein
LKTHSRHFVKIYYLIRPWWLKLVILATQETEIRRIVVRSQPKVNRSQDPISKKSVTKRAGRVAQVAS